MAGNNIYWCVICDEPFCEICDDSYYRNSGMCCKNCINTEEEEFDIDTSTCKSCRVEK